MPPDPDAARAVAEFEGPACELSAKTLADQGEDGISEPPPRSGRLRNVMRRSPAPAEIDAPVADAWERERQHRQDRG